MACVHAVSGRAFAGASTGLWLRRLAGLGREGEKTLRLPRGPAEPRQIRTNCEKGSLCNRSMALPARSVAQLRSCQRSTQFRNVPPNARGVLFGMTRPRAAARLWRRGLAALVLAPPVSAPPELLIGNLGIGTATSIVSSNPGGCPRRYRAIRSTPMTDPDTMSASCTPHPGPLVETPALPLEPRRSSTAPTHRLPHGRRSSHALPRPSSSSVRP